MLGRTLGHYRIEEKLGEGGMGVVYRARDLHLDRPVAIKVLRPDAVADPERRRRFVQEAKAASALQHPNIITIYDIDTADGVDFIAMEYVPGQTLGQRIGHKGLPLGEALRYGTEIAAALAAAHEAGIIHRDIKPANLMVSEKGQVKVLDFGLAKLTERDPADAQAETQTQDGSIVGTVAYMSPEQAQGLRVDTRSDIFAVGAVLYEVVTGRRAFQGETKVSTLSAILREEPPPVSELAPGTPRALERLIEHCLRKDPGRRLQNMGDVKTLLEDLLADSETRRPAVAPRPRRWRWAIAAGLLAAAGAAGALWWRSRPARPPRLPTLTRLTSDSGLTTDPALSPDGKLVAYASDRSGDGHLDIWVKQTAGGEPIRLTTDPADDSQPAFSPDGAQIAFRSERDGGGVYAMPALGGSERLLVRHGRRPRYSPDGKCIAYWIGETHGFGQLGMVSSTGGEPRTLQPGRPIQDGPGGALAPVWSPDSRYLLFQRSVRQADYDWWWASADTGEGAPTGAFAVFQRSGLPIQTLAVALAPEAWFRDELLFSAPLGDSAGIWRVPISPRTRTVTGTPQRLTFGAGLDTSPSVSAAGRLAFANVAENTNIWSLPLDADLARPTAEPQRLTEDPAVETHVDVSAGGTRIVFRTNRTGHWDLWWKDLSTGRQGPLTEDPAQQFFSQLAADGLRLSYWVGAPGKSAVYRMALSLGPAGILRPGIPEKACEECGFPSDLSADGKQLVFFGIGNDLGIWHEASGRRRTLAEKHEFSMLADPRFSPDQRWVAFHAMPELPRRQMFVIPVHPDRPTPRQEWIPITDGSAMDRFPAWSPNGSILYWLSERDGYRCLVFQRLDPATKRPRGPLQYLRHFHAARYSLLNFPNPNMARPAVARDKIVFSLAERTGNIWMTELPP